jgi:hypothetical protein
MDENWRPVLYWEGVYEVSDLGRVRSLPREMRAGRAGVRLHKGKADKQQNLADEYGVTQSLVSRIQSGERRRSVIST